MFRQSGLKINAEKTRYKKYTDFLFFDVGDGWEKLPKISFISFTKRKGGQTYNSSKTMGNSSTVKLNFYCVYLCVNSKQKILGLKTRNSNEAFYLARAVAKYLDVELKNYVKKSK